MGWPLARFGINNGRPGVLEEQTGHLCTFEQTKRGQDVLSRDRISRDGITVLARDSKLDCSIEELSSLGDARRGGMRNELSDLLKYIFLTYVINF